MEITPETLKKSYLGINGEKTVLTLIREHNENLRLLVGKDYTIGTMKRYEVTLRHLTRYIRKKYDKNDLSLSKVDHEFITGLELFLKVDRNCEHNTAMKYIRNFKKIINSAIANGLIRKDPFASFKMTTKKVNNCILK